jgi:hypothetical protein
VPTFDAVGVQHERKMTRLPGLLDGDAEGPQRVDQGTHRTVTHRRSPVDLIASVPGGGDGRDEPRRRAR